MRFTVERVNLYLQFLFFFFIERCIIFFRRVISLVQQTRILRNLSEKYTVYMYSFSLYID